MKRAASSGHGRNVGVIIAPHAVNHFSGVHKPAAHAKNQWLMGWMGPCEGLILYTLSTPVTISSCTLQADILVIHA
jgi:hypothetical protein